MTRKQLKVLNPQRVSRHEFILCNLVISSRVKRESRIYQVRKVRSLWLTSGNRDHLQLIEHCNQCLKEYLRKINI